MRLVAYLRVSSVTQLDGYGLDAQRKAVNAWAKANGHKIVAWCKDEGVSGTVDAADRPGLAEAISYLRHPPHADGIVFPRLDRLARALTIQEAALALIWRLGGRAFTADAGEVHQDDPDDPMRTAVRQVMGVFAELDRRTVVKRMRDGRLAKAATGRKAVGQYAYGTRGAGTGRERDAAPRDDERAVIDRMLAMRAEGMSFRAIAAALDADGIPPRRGTNWQAMTVKRILDRESDRPA